MTVFEKLYVTFVTQDDGSARIRKWSQFPFEGAHEYIAAALAGDVTEDKAREGEAPAPSQQQLRSVDRPVLRADLIQDIGQSERDVLSEQHHRDASDPVSQIGIDVDDTPTAVGLSDGSVPALAAGPVHADTNSEGLSWLQCTTNKSDDYAPLSPPPKSNVRSLLPERSAAVPDADGEPSDTVQAPQTNVVGLVESGQAFANQVRAITHKLHGQAYSSTVSALNQFDADLRRARAALAAEGRE